MSHLDPCWMMESLEIVVSCFWSLPQILQLKFGHQKVQENVLWTKQSRVHQVCRRSPCPWSVPSLHLRVGICWRRPSRILTLLIWTPIRNTSSQCPAISAAVCRRPPGLPQLLHWCTWCSRNKLSRRLQVACHIWSIGWLCPHLRVGDSLRLECLGKVVELWLLSFLRMILSALSGQWWFDCLRTVLTSSCHWFRPSRSVQK